MHELPFADAVRPGAVSVLKLLMLRYAVGHEILLLAGRNPLVVLGEEGFEQLPGEEQRLAVIMAADVCCQGWAEHHARYSRWQRFRVGRKWAQWRRAIRGDDFGAAAAAWRKYRAAGSESFPTEEMPNTGGEFRYFGQPEMAALVNFLQITCGLSEEEAFDYPLGLARMRRLAWLESEGSVRITNEGEAEVARRREEYVKAHPGPEFELDPKE